MVQEALGIPDVLRTILTNMDPCELTKYLKTNKDFEYVINNTDTIKKLVIDYVLPYYKGVTLGDL